MGRRPPGEFCQGGYCEVTEGGHGDGAGNGGCRHNKEVWSDAVAALVAEVVALFHTETVLFIHHYQAEVEKFHAFLDEGVGATTMSA